MRPLLFLLLCLAAPAAAQDQLRNLLTIGAGCGCLVGGDRTFAYDHGPAFTGNYEYRPARHFAVEAGFESALPPFTYFSRFGGTTAREFVGFLPFGLRGILPVAKDRLELFAGSGAAYIWHSGYESYDQKEANGWLWQWNLGLRVAVDRSHRWYLGTTARSFRDTGRPTQEWVVATGNLSWRF